MQTPKPLPTQEEIAARLSYDPVAGRLTWKRRADRSQAWNSRYAGRAAGNHNAGRQFVALGSGTFAAHRVIWKLVYGFDPPEDVDHRDGNGFNNRLENLRLATRTENMRNKGRKRSRALPKGVHALPGGGYRAKIAFNRRTIHIGVFSTADEAHTAYFTKAQALFGEFARAA